MTIHTEPKFGIVVVTYNRLTLLKQLLNSIDEMHPAPAHVVVINNASTDTTQTVLEEWRADDHGFSTDVAHLPENTGGAGGFRTGVQRALQANVDWVWLMDDDVVIEPKALQLANKWVNQFDAFMGQRLSPDGQIVNWAHTLSDSTGLAPLVPKSPFGSKDWAASNSGCFEGMFISRTAIESVGLPDGRFFITWDDAVYGWLLAQKHRVGFVRDVFLRRTIEMKSVGPKSFTVYSRNDLGRYYFIRNRAIQAKYFAQMGKLRRLPFSIGTIRVVLIEIARCVVVERRLAGLKVIVRAVRDERALYRDSSFTVPQP